MRRWWIACSWVWLSGLCLACGKSDPGAAAAAGSGGPTISAADMPPPKTSHRTTSGEIAIGNLTAQIKGLEAMIAAAEPGAATGTAAPTGTLAPAGTPAASSARPTGTLAPTGTVAPAAALAGRRRQLVDLLSVRAEFAGRIADLERAAQVAEGLPEQAPEADSFLSRAGARAALHRFEAASADLDEAEKRGAPAARVRAKRVSILEARGQLDEALALQRDAHSTRRDINAAVVRGVLLGELDRRDEALAAFREALSTYEDTSPFPIAWLFFQEGLLWEREGRKDLAVAYYQAAVDRVPAYAHAAAHLARLSAADKALVLLQPLLASSDDPEIEAVIADKLRESGDAAGAQAHVARAAARYEELMAREPAAFADHAAQFWLDTGGDAKKALDLAKINLQARKTPKAYELAVLAAMSAGDRKTACEIGTDGAKLPRATSMFREIVKGACEPR